MRSIKIKGSGIYLPPNKITANIPNKSGVRTRYFVKDENASFMAAYAINQALSNANMQLGDIDLIISASGGIEQFIPCNAALISQQLGVQAKGIPAFDINSTCMSFMVALDTISCLLPQGLYRNVAVVSSEVSSRGVDKDDEKIASLFGDGAVAFIVSQDLENNGSKILNSKFETYSEGAEFARVKGGGTKLPFYQYSENIHDEFLFQMEGEKIFKLALKYLPRLLEQVWSPHISDINELKLVIPHQASKTALDLVQRKLNVEKNKFLNIIEDYGNMIAASIPLGLHLAIEENLICKGDKVLLAGTSAGFSIGGLLIEY